MAFISTINDQSFTIEIKQKELTLDGQPYPVDWQPIVPVTNQDKGGQYSLILAGQSFDISARLLEKSDGRGSYEVFVDGQRFVVQVTDERSQLLLNKLAPAHKDGEISLRAPMPGLVLHVLKKPEESVERGESVIVLEAMKMENDLTAPQSGKIKEVRAQQGQTVNQGDVLVVIAKE